MQSVAYTSQSLGQRPLFRFFLYVILEYLFLQRFTRDKAVKTAGVLSFNIAYRHIDSPQIAQS